MSTSMPSWMDEQTIKNDSKVGTRTMPQLRKCPEFFYVLTFDLKTADVFTHVR